MAKRACIRVVVSGWLWVAGIASGQEVAPELRVEVDGVDVRVSVVGGVVEGGWVLQDSYGGTGWRDLDVLGPEGFVEKLTRVPSVQRYFRAAKKAMVTRQEALDAARAKWESWRPVRYHYRYTTSTSLGLADDLVLVDGDGRLESVSLLPRDGSPFRPTFGETVDDLFDRLQRAVDYPAHTMDVRYHPEFGYPERGDVNYELLLADEEWGFSVLTGPASPGEALAAARERWARVRARGGDYEYGVRFERGGRLFPFWEGRVRVAGGEASVVEGGEPPVGHVVLTVEAMFARIGEAIAAGKVVNAAYDAGTGVPVFFGIDWYLTATDGPGERRWVTFGK